MTDETSKFIEQGFQERFARAKRLLDAGEMEAALRAFHQIDLAFPNRREVVNGIRECKRALGQEIVQHRTLEEVEKKSSKDFEEPEQTWDDDDLIARRVSGPVKGRVAETVPILTDFSVAPDREEEPPPRRRDTSVIYQLATFGLLVAFGLVIFRELFTGPEAGDRREFAGMQFVWVPTQDPQEEPAAGPFPFLPQSTPGYWVGRYEVTMDDWNRIMEDSESPRNRDAAPNRLPVTELSPEQTVAFIEVLNRQGEGRFRVPTEAEWERACRAGVVAPTGGDSDLIDIDAYAWHGRNSGGQLHETGTRRPNALGIHDMLGNAMEWCVVGAPPPSGGSDAAPLGYTGYKWVTRGGHAGTNAPTCSTAMAPEDDLDFPRRYAGLRLIRDPGPSTKAVLRVLEFPEEEPAIGTLLIEGRTRGPAIGPVTVLEEERVTLVVEKPEDGSINLAPLKNLKPDDLFGLVIEDQRVPPSQWPTLEHLTGLREIVLTNTSLTSETAAFLHRLQDLELIDLSGTSVDGRTLSGLTLHANLHTLRLNRAQSITDDDIEMLKRLENLQFLELEESSVTTDAITDLQLSLPLCSITPSPDLPPPELGLQWARIGGRYSMLVHQRRIDSEHVTRPVCEELGFQPVELPDGGGTFYGYHVHVTPYLYVWQYTRRFRPRLQSTPYFVRNIEGPPDMNNGDYAGTVWSPVEGLRRDDWLLVEFGAPVQPRRLRMIGRGTIPVETLYAYDLEGREWRVYETRANAEPQRPKSGEQTYELRNETNDLPILDRLVSRVRIKFAPGSDPDFAIDAIVIVDGLGQSHWVQSATSRKHLFGSSDESESDLESTEEGSRQGPEDIHYRGFLRFFPKGRE